MPNKILLVQQNWLGDVLFATPAIRAVRKKYPAAHIACLVPPRVEAVLKHNPQINEVIVCDDRASFFSPVFWKTALKLRAAKFDTAIFFHRSKTRAWLAWFGGIGERWGYASAGRRHLLTRAVVPPPGSPHKIDFFLHLVEALGISPDGRHMEFAPASEAATSLEKKLLGAGVSGGEPYAVVHAGGNWKLKRWPSEYFCQWIYFYLGQYGGKVVLCGTGDEKGIAAKIAARFPAGGVVSLCGQTSLDELALLLKGARLLLSNDSGPIHLAASQRTKIVGLFGPTSAAQTGPVSEAPMRILSKDVGCRVPCYFSSCDYRVCMETLLPHEVFAETRVLLEAS